MRRKRIVIILVIVIFLLVAAGAISYYFFSEKKSPTLKEKPPERVSSASLKKTIITPHMEQAIINGKNIVYCSTFQLAWNELKDGVVKEDIKITDEPPIVKILNKGLSTKADLSEKDYIAMAGFVRNNIVMKINEALKKKFKDETTPFEGAQLPPDGIVFYSFLNKNLEFKKDFAFHSDGQIFKVKAFGINDCATMECLNSHKKYIKQVDVLYYPDEDIGNILGSVKGLSLSAALTEYINFVIRLNTKESKDEIILAKIKPEETLQKTIEAVQKLIKNSKPVELSTIDTLSIPKFWFDIEHTYGPLQGKHLQNKGVTGFPISRATQTIMFKLDEKGAMVKSTSSMVAAALARYLVFDRPFLIYLKEKNATWPYFAMWVANPELMKNL
jgi:flagellar basal body-associated protein FliL